MGFDSAYRSVRGGVSKAYKKAAPIAKKNAPIVRDAYMANTPKETRQKHAKSYAMVKSDFKGGKSTVQKDFGPSSKKQPAVISPRAQTYAPRAESTTPRSQSASAVVEKAKARTESKMAKMRNRAMYGAYGRPPMGRPRY